MAINKLVRSVRTAGGIGWVGRVRAAGSRRIEMRRQDEIAFVWGVDCWTKVAASRLDERGAPH